MQLFDVAGRVAVVTGGNGGIGLGIAEGLAQAGATVVIAGRDAGKNAAAVEKLAALGAPAAAIETDIRDPDACRALIAQAAERFGRRGSWSTMPASAAATRRRTTRSPSGTK